MNQNEFKNRLIFDIVYNNIAFTTAQEEASDLIEFIRYYAKLRISAMVINRFGERDQSGRWCCAVNGL